MMMYFGWPCRSKMSRCKRIRESIAFRSMRILMFTQTCAFALCVHHSHMRIFSLPTYSMGQQLISRHTHTHACSHTSLQSITPKSMYTTRMTFERSTHMYAYADVPCHKYIDNARYTALTHRHNGAHSFHITT